VLCLIRVATVSCRYSTSEWLEQLAVAVRLLAQLLREVRERRDDTCSDRVATATLRRISSLVMRSDVEDDAGSRSGTDSLFGKNG